MGRWYGLISGKEMLRDLDYAPYVMITSLSHNKIPVSVAPGAR